MIGVLFSGKIFQGSVGLNILPSGTESGRSAVYLARIIF